MLPRNAILGGVALVVVAFYWKLWNVRVFREQDELLEQLQGSYRPASEPVVLMLGRSFFFIATAAWVVLSLQTLFQGYQRARYRPKITQPLQPLSPEAAQQQQASDTDTTAPSTSGLKITKKTPSTSVSTAAAAASAPQQQQQDWREQRRLQALEAAQRALDEKAAALKQQQLEEEEARKARRAQATEAVAKQQAEKAAAEAAARSAAAAAAEAAAQAAAEARAAFAAAAAAQWHGLAPPTPVQGDGTGIPGDTTTAAGGSGGGGLNAAGGDSSNPAAANAAAAALDRDIRHQQDMEYQQSLERDRAKAAAKAAQRKADAAALQLQARQQRLAALRQHLQHNLAPEPLLTTPDSEAPPLTLRVRLPGGGTASRRFSAGHAFGEVFAWVFSLPEMQLWAPGTWSLVSGFPRRQLLPPADSSWAPGVWEAQQQQEGAGGGGEEMLLPGEWMLRVDRLEQAALWVKVHEGSTLAEVQEEVEAQTGIPQKQQRLIFAGHILQSPYCTLQQLHISTGHRLQLAGLPGGSSSTSGGGGSSGGGAGGGTQHAAGSGVDPDSRDAAERAKEVGKAAEQSYLGSGDVLVVQDVGELQEKVAHGAAQLALYVEALPSQES